MESIKYYGQKYLLGTNHCLPLSHMAKSYIRLEGGNQRINEFSIGYMMNPNLSMKKIFQRASESMYETYILYINHYTYQ